MIGPNCSRNEHTPPVTQRRFGTIWGELAYLCRKIHEKWFPSDRTCNAKLSAQTTHAKWAR